MENIIKNYAKDSMPHRTILGLFACLNLLVCI